jgi:hypothetical protein
MIVRCIRLLNALGEPVRTSKWLTIGKEYLVLEVFVDEQTGSRFRVISDDAGTPILARSSEFEAVSDAIPKCWVATFGPGCRFDRRPNAERPCKGQVVANPRF